MYECECVQTIVRLTGGVHMRTTLCLHDPAARVRYHEKSSCVNGARVDVVLGEKKNRTRPYNIIVPILLLLLLLPNTVSGVVGRLRRRRRRRRVRSGEILFHNIIFIFISLMLLLGTTIRRDIRYYYRIFTINIFQLLCKIIIL